MLNANVTTEIPQWYYDEYTQSGTENINSSYENHPTSADFLIIIGQDYAVAKKQ